MPSAQTICKTNILYTWIVWLNRVTDALNYAVQIICMFAEWYHFRIDFFAMFILKRFCVVG